MGDTFRLTSVHFSLEMRVCFSGTLVCRRTQNYYVVNATFTLGEGNAFQLCKKHKKRRHCYKLNNYGILPIRLPATV